MKTIQLKHGALALMLLTLAACQPKTQPTTQDPLSAWSDTSIKKSIVAYLTDSIASIPVEDRIAVFDMDGTIACETPLWLEMYAAVNGLNDQSKNNPALLKQKEYEYAALLAINPFDTMVHNHWGPYIDSMVWKAYANIDNEVYIDSARVYLERTKSKDPRFTNIPLANLFYQPMLQLLQYLKEKQFTIYIVSGSVQGVIWSTCPQTIGFDRQHLIGTVQKDTAIYDTVAKKTMFVIQKGIYQPKNNNDGKSQNIYTRLGKVPVFAFGNTTGDFGMFRLTSTSPHPHACYLLNHDDSIREYSYLPWHGDPDTTWQQTMQQNRWNTVSMSTDFKQVWPFSN